MTDLSSFFGPNAGYVLELYDRYRLDPNAVDPETRAIFERWQPSLNGSASPPTDLTHVPGTDVTKIVAAARLARMIRELGHRAASLDPLGSPPPGDPDLELATHGLEPADLAALPPSVVGGPLAIGARNALEATERLRRVYSGPVGYEDYQVQVHEERRWLREAAESGRFFQGFSDEHRLDLLQRLTEVEVFERFIHANFVGQKRFSLEGLDIVIPMLDLIVHDAAAAGTREVVMGMAHRGRLNVLAHVLGKPYEAVLAEFQSAHDAAPEPAISGAGSSGWMGDVKYHLGARMAYRENGVSEMPITLAPNPSHLEFVNPVVLGRTRAAQEHRDGRGDPNQDPKAAGAILIHGDAAFPGEGIVAETLNLSQLRGYCIGGTLHIILNNQIGFTTEPRDARSTLYASDLAKGFEIPIVHVNADDPLACLAVAQMAFAYARTFHKDFLIDLIGYRRWGHNEGDEPSFTQPALFEAISRHPTVRERWAGQLVRDGLITPDEVDTMLKEAYDRMGRARADSPGLPPAGHDTMRNAPSRPRAVETAVPEEALIRLNEELLDRPREFSVNPKLRRSFERRRAAIREEGGIEWGLAESLAFASILADGVPIRFSGQDSERGTFSHRHLVLHDPVTGRRYCPLQALPSARATFAVYNSPLSENAVLGFEYGYSMHARDALVLWEAQFGDFANSAQVIIDQFIVSGNAKWRQAPSLVLLLPHGLEGQGPEHSSARPERYLELCAGDNLRVVNPTTAAQYFHLLRRQAAHLRDDPRPLVVLTPKSLLRHPRAGSSLADLTHGSFRAVLDDARARDRAESITRLILCSGKVYVDLAGQEAFAAAERIAVARVEELYPFPERDLQRLISSYPNLRQIDWLQEEPRNMGAWSYVEPRLRDLMTGALELSYIGRAESSSPAEGSARQHAAEQSRILAAALLGAPALEPQGVK